MLGTKVVEEIESKFNRKLRVVKTWGMGTYVQVNGLTQSGGIVETIWKQTLRQVKGERQEIKEVLILGLGGGTVAKLINKKWPEAKITGVEIDPVIIKLGEKYLDLDTKTVDVKIGDVFDFLKKVKENFDLIIVDLYQGDKFPEEFGSDSYIKMIKERLNNNGVVIFNRLYYADKRPTAVKFGNILGKHFHQITWFYPEANLMFLCKI